MPEVVDESSPKAVLNVLKYPSTEYCSLLSVSCSNSSSNLSLLITLNDLISASKRALIPVDLTLIVVSVE